MVHSLNFLLMWAATYFIHSTLLLGGVWLWFRTREPGSHAFREAVWKLAAVCGLLTATVQLGLGVESPINVAVNSAWNTTFAPTPVTKLFAPHAEDHNLAKFDATSDHRMQVDFDQADEAADTGTHLLPSDTVSDEFAGAGADLAQFASATLEQSNRTASPRTADGFAPSSAAIDRRWGRALIGVLAALCGATLALSIWGFVRLLSEQWDFRQRLATCRPITSGTSRHILNELLAESRIRRPVCLMLDENDLEPGACGWFNWQIVIPARAVEELSPQELRGLLAHELAHLVRHDQWWLLAGRLLAVCFAWQPLNRIALREWQRASEYLCDAWAIDKRVPRLSLARCLTTVAEWRLVGLATMAGLGSGPASNLSQRVERLIDDAPLADPWQRYGRRHLLAAAGCLIAVGMVSLAPAATLPARPEKSLAQTPQIESPTDEQSAAAVTHLETRAESAPSDSGAELVATNVEDIHAEVLVTVELIEVMRRDVSTDMLRLTSELNALQQAMLELPTSVRHPLWQIQVHRLRERMETIHRLRNAMLVPL